MHQGTLHHQKGDARAATQCYREILLKEPNHPDALHLLGILAFQSGELEKAENLVKKAIKETSRNEHYLNALGEILRGQKKWDEAEKCYKASLAIEPNNWQVISNEGCLFLDKRDHISAIEKFEKALEIAPTEQSLYINLGKAYLDLKQYKKSINLLKKIVETNPLNWQAWTNLSVAYRKNHNRAEAKACIDKAISLNPNNINVLTAYGTTMVAFRQWNLALKTYNAILKKDANNVDAYINIASIQKEFDDIDDAIINYKKALAIEAENERALFGLADSYCKTNNMSIARCFAKKGTELFSNNSEFWNLYSRIERQAGNVNRADELLEKAIEVDSVNDYCDFGKLFFYNHRTDLSPIEIKQKHEQWAEAYAAKHYPKSGLRNPIKDSFVRRVRVGLVSGDWLLHPVAQFSESILRYLDKERFELFCYSALQFSMPRTKEIATIPEHWRDIAFMDDEGFYEQILKDEIDILIDLQGHTSASRLFVFARKPAPLQLTYLGYPNTTGLKTIDYRLSDELADPSGITDDHYTEEVYRIKHCAWCFSHWPRTPPVSGSPFYKTNSITFGCFNNFFKINDDIKRNWIKILEMVPNSVIYLKSKPFADDEVVDNVKKQFEEAGIAKERIVCKGWVDGVEAHLRSYNEVDIALDTFPYNGTTTTCEALLMGVPVISLAGGTHVSRVGVSLLSNVGLDEFIATSEKEYIEKAISLALKPERLLELRRTLRSKMETSTLMDGPGFAKRFGDALQDMWNSKVKEASER